MCWLIKFAIYHKGTEKKSPLSDMKEKVFVSYSEAFKGSHASMEVNSVRMLVLKDRQKKGNY